MEKGRQAKGASGENGPEEEEEEEEEEPAAAPRSTQANPHSPAQNAPARDAAGARDPPLPDRLGHDTAAGGRTTGSRCEPASPPAGNRSNAEALALGAHRGPVPP